MLKIEEYKRNTKSSKWQLTETKEKHNFSYTEFINKIVDAAPFFRSLGGYERRQGDYSHISISPDRLTKKVYSWVPEA